MKKRIFITLCVIVSSIALLLSAYFLFGRKLSPEDSISKYKNVKVMITGQDMILTINETNEMLIANETFSQTSQKSMHYDIIGDNIETIYAQETILSGSHKVEITELYSDNKLYTTVNGYSFLSTTDKPESFILPNEQLYNNISGKQTQNGYTLSFSEALTPEKWITTAEVKTYTGNGQVYIDKDNFLTGLHYTASYTIDEISYRTTITMDISRENVEITIPNDASDYTQLDNPEALRTLEIACGYLLQVNNISSEYEDNIYLQAMGDRRTQVIKSESTANPDWRATIQTNISLENDSREDQVTNYSKTEQFSDGEYTITTDGGTPISNKDITLEEMQKYFQNQLLSTMMLPQYISSVSTTETDSTIRYTFAGNKQFTKFLTENACRILYQNPNLLEEDAENIVPKVYACYFTIDKYTNLPTDSGIIFTGEYKTSAIPYLLEYHAQQIYRIAD